MSFPSGNSPCAERAHGARELWLHTPVLCGASRPDAGVQIRLLTDDYWLMMGLRWSQSIMENSQQSPRDAIGPTHMFVVSVLDTLYILSVLFWVWWVWGCLHHSNTFCFFIRKYFLALFAIVILCSNVIEEHHISPNIFLYPPVAKCAPCAQSGRTWWTFHVQRIPGGHLV